MATRDAQDKALVEPAVRPSRPLRLPDVSVSLVDADWNRQPRPGGALP